MSISMTEISGVRALEVTVTDDALVVDLADGRSVSVPLVWYPRLFHGTKKERAKWRIIGIGEGIHWPDLDEDVSVEGLLAGKASGESQSSLKRWLTFRAARKSESKRIPKQAG
jgi:hypothetical protein